MTQQPPRPETAAGVGMREQVPARLRVLDDPWGITWRVRNKLRRIDPARWYRQQRARFLDLHQERPVFVVGIPRSGTTALYRVLAAHPGLRSLGYEGHDCWRRFHHPRRHGWSSDWVGAEQVTRRERRFVPRWWFARVGDGRFIDKTPDNAMRITYLLELFPDAHIVWVKRDPRAVLNSLLTGWEHPLGRFRTYFLPEKLDIPGYAPTRQWCFGLIEGWRDLRNAPIPTIVAEQYRQYNEGALMGRSVVPAGQWHEVAFEQLLADPRQTMTTLLDRLGLGHHAATIDRAAALRGRAENTMNADGPSDWRDHEEAVIGIVGQLRGVITVSGYDVDALLAGGDPVLQVAPFDT